MDSLSSESGEKRERLELSPQVTAFSLILTLILTHSQSELRVWREERETEAQLTGDCFLINTHSH